LKMLVLADDLTGALEVGAKFAREGIFSLVTTELSLSPPYEGENAVVLVVDTDSRHTSPADAARRVRILSSLALARQVPYIYKKTDSTLRGNIGRELESLSKACGGLPILYFPAYPEMERTVERGRLFVRGKPVHETDFASDALNPVCESHIPSLLSAQTPLPVYSPALLEHGKSIPAGIHVCDGITDQDVLSCARYFLKEEGLRLAAGPAAFAHGLARVADWPRTRISPIPSIDQCLILSGSRSDISIRQIEHALACGFPLIEGSAIEGKASGPHWLIFKQAADEGGRPLDFARRTGAAVREILQESALNALCIFGGDTTRAVVQALGAPTLYACGEVVPGIPISRIVRPGSPDLYLITKAGGFGTVDIIPELHRRLVPDQLSGPRA
jgi:uncharacterized protein YgbK (DUF1537 family)